MLSSFLYPYSSFRPFHSLGSPSAYSAMQKPPLTAGLSPQLLVTVKVGIAPPRLRHIRLQVRAIVLLAGFPGPSRPNPKFIPISSAIGPLTMNPWPSRPSPVPADASAIASTTGRYSGLHPAITAFTATCSTVAVLLIGIYLTASPFFIIGSLPIASGATYPSMSL